MRPKKKVDYNIDDWPKEDEFIFCERCQEPKYYGCKIHPVIFNYVAQFEVGPSKAGKNAGRGVLAVLRLHHTSHQQFATNPRQNYPNDLC